MVSEESPANADPVTADKTEPQLKEISQTPKQLKKPKNYFISLNDKTTIHYKDGLERHVDPRSGDDGGADGERARLLPW